MRNTRQVYCRRKGNLRQTLVATHVRNEAPRSKLRGIKAEFRRSQKPAFALTSFGAVRLAFAQRRRLRRVSSLQQVADAP
jgi:hypothetical protein